MDIHIGKQIHKKGHRLKKKKSNLTGSSQKGRESKKQSEKKNDNSNNNNSTRAHYPHNIQTHLQAPLRLASLFSYSPLRYFLSITAELRGVPFRVAFICPPTFSPHLPLLLFPFFPWRCSLTFHFFLSSKTSAHNKNERQVKERMGYGIKYTEGRGMWVHANASYPRMRCGQVGRQLSMQKSTRKYIHTFPFTALHYRFTPYMHTPRKLRPLAEMKKGSELNG